MFDGSIGRLFAGTPTEQTWPGISSNDEFVAYNYPQYRAERLSNHTPRYVSVLHTGTQISVFRHKYCSVGYNEDFKQNFILK